MLVNRLSGAKKQQDNSCCFLIRYINSPRLYLLPLLFYQMIMHFVDCSGFSITIRQEHPWAVLIVSEVMKRIHSIQTGNDIAFIDSTSSCDVTHSTLTNILIASQAGALPVAVLIHEGQTSQSYETALNLLNENYDHCFGNRKVSASIV